MKISRFSVNPFAENVYILWNDATHHAMVIDPGMMTDNERRAFDNFAGENNLDILNILLTHQHADHVLSAAYVAEKYQASILAHSGDAELGQSLSLQAQMLGFPDNLQPFTVSKIIADGDVLKLDDEEIHVLHTPGHTPGGVSFYIPDEACVMVGDTLFQQSVGRTDFPGGDYAQLIGSVKDKLLTLPDDTVVHPGHGPSTTIGDEQSYNPFLR